MSDVCSRRFRAIGTTVEVVVDDPAALEHATELVRDQVDALDAAASRFREDSELSRLNAASGRPTPVSWLLFVAVEEALAAAALTDGVVDPTVGHAVERCGYDRDFADVAPEGPPIGVRFRRVPGWRRVRTDRHARTITLPPGVRMDLGATAKAGCADRAARAAAVTVRTGVLVNLGGDLAVAGPCPSEGWVVRVADRHDAPPGDPGERVAVHHGGMATSGTAARRWLRGGRQVHHIVDPATGAPAVTAWRTVTVAADTCLDANVASTAAVVLGSKAPEWLADRAFPARLTAEDGSLTRVGGWPAEVDPGNDEVVTA